MDSLLLSILCSSTIFILFKIFERYKIQLLQAIVINYFAAFCVGFLSYEGTTTLTSIHQTPWVYGAICLSILFISVFNLMGITSQKNGVAVAAVAGKMAVVIPIIFGVYLYHEQLNASKIVGIIMALIAILLTVYKNTTDNKKGSFLFPILLFLGAGIIDTIIKYVQKTAVSENELPLFSASIFLFAGIIGIVVFFFRPSALHLKNCIAGIALGTVNYYSIYFLLKALDRFEKEFAHLNLGSGITYTINNVSIVICTTIFGVLFFKEQLNIKNWIGIIIAIISLFLITN